MNKVFSNYLELFDVSYHYKNKLENVEIFKNLNLTIYPGEMVALLGPSGSGKSTLLNCIGLLDKFISGKFKILNKDYSLLTESEITNIRLNDIGFVFQNHRLFPEFSALENIIIPSLIKKIPFDEAKKKATQILTYLNLEHRINHRPAKLSGGESQRVAIGRALSNNPKFILADEPTGNLDKDNTLLIFNILKKITLDTEKSCIIATHNNFLAEKMDRIFLIENQNIKILK
ncbi:MAG: lipoprotein-releasing system ATP-binding protein LolD [Alphaproteobacteria bacterium]|nr:MAG: lipoprotein-releasing system ATP-binding protein LolD [Alphaproteobacteria bacterium]